MAAALQRELGLRMQQLQLDLNKRQELVNAEQSENEKLRAEAAAKDAQMAALQAQLRDAQAAQARRAYEPISDHSVASSAGTSARRRTPRASQQRAPEPFARDLRTPTGPMTAEEKQLRRLAYDVKRKEETTRVFLRRCDGAPP